MTESSYPDPDVQFNRDHAKALARQSGWTEGYQTGKRQGLMDGLLQAAAIAERYGCGKPGCTDCYAGAAAVEIRETAVTTAFTPREQTK